MSEIIYNKRLSRNFFLMTVEHANSAEMGQFYMVRAWDRFPVLSRPLSVYDADARVVSFLYKVVGTGTEIFARLKAGDAITLQGPLGNTVPDMNGKIAMVGGGVGIAPLRIASRRLKELHPECVIDMYLGFSDEAVLQEEFARSADRMTVDVGGFITDKIDPAGYDHIFTCGPEVMMRVLYDRCKAAGVGGRLVVSMESRMACGFGACMTCSCETVEGNRKVCRDGPIFKGEAVFGL